MSAEEQLHAMDDDAFDAVADEREAAFGMRTTTTDDCFEQLEALRAAAEELISSEGPPDWSRLVRALDSPASSNIASVLNKHGIIDPDYPPDSSPAKEHFVGQNLIRHPDDCGCGKCIGRPRYGPRASSPSELRDRSAPNPAIRHPWSKGWGEASSPASEPEAT